jgi:hypothetical protein
MNLLKQKLKADDSSIGEAGSPDRRKPKEHKRVVSPGLKRNLLQGLASALESIDVSLTNPEILPPSIAAQIERSGSEVSNAIDIAKVSRKGSGDNRHGEELLGGLVNELVRLESRIRHVGRLSWLDFWVIVVDHKKYDLDDVDRQRYQTFGAAYERYHKYSKTQTIKRKLTIDIVIVIN